jgi:hypothetical protein
MVGIGWNGLNRVAGMHFMLVPGHVHGLPTLFCVTVVNSSALGDGDPYLLSFLLLLMLEKYFSK